MSESITNCEVRLTGWSKALHDRTSQCRQSVSYHPDNGRTRAREVFDTRLSGIMSHVLSH
jgi:hypothetical protein